MLEVAVPVSSGIDQLILLFLIFFARILDVSVGTLRIIFVSKGLKYWSAILGFAESLIWILAISKVMQNLGDWQTYVAFALGFAVGNFVGIALEERIALGSLLIRVITRAEAPKLVSSLRTAGYGVTSVQGQGDIGNVKVVFTLVKRKKLAKVIAVIKEQCPNAFYSIEDVRFASGSVFYPPIPSQKSPVIGTQQRK
ncbi:Uncharacterized protein YebE, UPF0316 family [Malonomonas rubra DSM 5091]|uniref:UPF0316 protein SAMN02745165_02751 n=1 Tax=Malonomonas rubra DSM 5091 TaxID=1122189 RepID=A0A1M6KPK5_MALRU|nr:DUF2179 domain-containing protein [Malonomonas rubra]SHJ60899.1 Uncharacterized protein YebE, UPF0316 family [Malonomonas rubra DSM 5091]